MSLTFDDNLKIAKYVGWKFGFEDEMGSYWIPPEGGNQVSIKCIPDYLNDLNAIHEAEGKLRGSSGEYNYVMILETICKEETPPTEIWYASSIQRATALLKTIEENAVIPFIKNKK